MSDGTEGQDRESYSDDQDRDNYHVEDGGDFPEHVAWTGGDRPAPAVELSDAEWAYVKKLFVADMDTWRAFWQESSVPLELRNLFWSRARYDAHATFRAAAREAERATS